LFPKEGEEKPLERSVLDQIMVGPAVGQDFIRPVSAETPVRFSGRHSLIFCASMMPEYKIKSMTDSIAFIINLALKCLFCPR
jgi:hypothetical protein